MGNTFTRVSVPLNRYHGTDVGTVTRVMLSVPATDQNTRVLSSVPATDTRVYQQQGTGPPYNCTRLYIVRELPVKVQPLYRN